MTIQVVIEKGVITSVQTTGAEENATLPLPPLHNTVLGGHLEVCEFLLERGANLEDTDNKVSFFSFFFAFFEIDTFRLQGWTPLHWAAIHGRMKICKFLLEKGAKLEATDNKVSFFLLFFLLFSRLTHSVCRDIRHCTGQQSMVT